MKTITLKKVSILFDLALLIAVVCVLLIVHSGLKENTIKRVKDNQNQTTSYLAYEIDELITSEISAFEYTILQLNKNTPQIRKNELIKRIKLATNIYIVDEDLSVKEIIFSRKGSENLAGIDLSSSTTALYIKSAREKNQTVFSPFIQSIFSGSECLAVVIPLQSVFYVCELDAEKMLSFVHSRFKTLYENNELLFIHPTSNQVMFRSASVYPFWQFKPEHKEQITINNKSFFYHLKTIETLNIELAVITPAEFYEKSVVIFTQYFLFLIVLFILFYMLRVFFMFKGFHKPMREFLSAFEEKRMVSVPSSFEEWVTLEKSYNAALNFSTNVIKGAPAIICGIALDGTTTFINPAGVRITGYTNEEITGKSWWKTFYSENIHKQIQQLFTNLENESLRDHEMTLTRKDGKKRIIVWNFINRKDEHGNTFEIIGFGNDITEKKAAEESLRASEEKYRNILESIEDVYFEVDLAGSFTFFNKSLVKVSGYTAQELLGSNNRDYMDDENAKKIYRIFNKVYQTGKPTKGEDWEFFRKDGSRCSVEIVVSLIKDGNGNPSGFRGIARDVTERRLAESHKRKLERQLQQAQKLEAIGTLAGGIAHDFNNLLMGIQGRTSLMMNNLDSSNRNYEHLQGISGYVKSAVDLTKQLLGLAKGGKYEVKPTEINALIRKSAEMFGRTKKEITIHSRYQENLWTVEVERGQIEQALLNIFVNAWQAMPGGGDLYIETQNLALDEDYTKPYEVKAGRYVKISVTDTGIGMDQETQAKIFDPFFTTKEMDRGTGLGLASVYGIIKNHNGFINVYSEKGAGTRFSIYLPASGKEVIDEKAADDRIQKGTGTVLLIDDEEMIIKVTQEMLENLGYNVLAAIKGKDAIELYKKEQNQIDVVVMDMIMPDLDGGAVYDQLKMINPEVKTILSSGYSMNGKATDILNRGCNGFIQKPFTLEDISKKLKEVLNQ